MKRTLLLLSLFVATTMAFAQLPGSKAVITKQKQFEKSKETMADPVKGADPENLIAHANLLVDMNKLYTSTLIQDMDMAFTPNLVGRPVGSPEDVTFGENTYKKYPFDRFDLYTQDNKIIFWVTTKNDYPTALEDAYECLEKAKDGAPKSFVAAGRGAVSEGRLKEEYRTIAFSYFYREMFDKAGDNFLAAAKCDELIGVMDTATYYSAGVCYNQAGKLEEAKTYIQKVVDAGYSREGSAESTLADILTQLDRPEEAITILEKAITKYPTNVEILFKTINAYIKANKDPHSIIETLKLAEKADPTNVSLYLVEANLNMKLGDTTAFAACLNKSLEIDPNCVQAFYGLAEIEVAAANLLYAEAQKIPMNDQKGYDAKLEERAVRLRKAVEYYEKAYALNPNDLDTVSTLRQFYYQLRKEGDDKTEERYNFFNDLEKKMQESAPQQ